jgi:hypothetical protein
MLSHYHGCHCYGGGWGTAGGGSLVWAKMLARDQRGANAGIVRREMLEAGLREALDGDLSHKVSARPDEACLLAHTRRDEFNVCCCSYRTWTFS